MVDITDIIFNSWKNIPVCDCIEPKGELDGLRKREAIRQAMFALKDAGFVIAPIEPTEAMVVAMVEEATNPRDMYAAAIQAAQEEKL